MANEHHNSVGAWIRAERVRLRLSRESLARRVGVVAKTIERWELGRHEPGAGDLLLLQKALGSHASSGAGTFRMDTTVPRGAVQEPAAGTVAGQTARRMMRALMFEREMIRAGATNEDADYIRARAESFLATVLQGGGSEAELDAEFESYLEQHLRQQVQARITARQGTVTTDITTPAGAVPAPSKAHRPPKKKDRHA